MFKQERNLETQLQTGRYFAKASEIFPADDFEEKSMNDIKGIANQFMRRSGLRFYREQVESLETALDGTIEPENTSLPASEASSHTAEKNQRRKCIIPGTKGHKRHQGCDSAPFGAWWALVYLWMIGRVEKFDDQLRKIEAENDPAEKAELKKKLYKALIVMTNGARNGMGGMRSNVRNILYVPSPHAKYYDIGCNWVIFPIQTKQQMLDWKGEAYELAIFVGQRKESDC